MKVGPTPSPWLRVQQAADLLGISASTVRRWAADDKIACRRSASGQRRFLSSDLERVLRDGGPPSADHLTALERAEQRYQLLLDTSLELASTLDLDELLQVGRPTPDRRTTDP